MSRLKKSRSLKGRLAKTGTKEMLKEQKKARKAASPSRFDAKKAKQRKLQAQRKLERQGELPDVKEEAPKARPKRFTFVPSVEEPEVRIMEEDVEGSTEVSVNDLLDAFAEEN